ncbi:hypothetical protein KCV00_g382, partial [Aureobasidium melanogenum]
MQLLPFLGLSPLCFGTMVRRRSECALVGLVFDEQRGWNVLVGMRSGCRRLVRIEVEVWFGVSSHEGIELMLVRRVSQPSFSSVGAEGRKRDKMREAIILFVVAARPSASRNAVKLSMLTPLSAQLASTARASILQL